MSFSDQKLTLRLLNLPCGLPVDHTSFAANVAEVVVRRVDGVARRGRWRTVPAALEMRFLKLVKVDPLPRNHAVNAMSDPVDPDGRERSPAEWRADRLLLEQSNSSVWRRENQVPWCRWAEHTLLWLGRVQVEVVGMMLR